MFQIYYVISEAYIKAWFTDPQAIVALRRNLALLKSLLELSNKNVFYDTSQMMSKRLHSLSKVLVDFSFFDGAVLFERKQQLLPSYNMKMVKKIP